MSRKFHLGIMAEGQVDEGFLSGGNANDVEAAPELAREAVGCRAAEDRGYESDRFRRTLEGIIKFRSYRDKRTGRKG
jgi:hypothetical protein